MYYVFSDVHGCYAEMMEALTQWDREHETLVVMGDLIDRGPDSLRVVQELHALQQTYGEKVVVLAGNHDQSFSRWAGHAHPEMMTYAYKETHNETIESCYPSRKRFKKASRKQRGEHVRHLFKPELRFLLNLPLYLETEHCVFVHAGINLQAENWRYDTHAMTHIREPFYLSNTKAQKRVFFGHTPTSLIREDAPISALFKTGSDAFQPETEDHSVWLSEHGDKVGLDGGVSFGGQLNAVRVDAQGRVTETLTFPARTSQNVCQSTEPTPH